jgi:hypothetical protein
MGILTPFEIKQRLNEAVDVETQRYMADSRTNNINTFTRERKLPLKTVVKILLSMGGGDIAQELEKQNVNVSKAAFSQRRKKISAQLFEDIFEQFNDLCADTDTQTYKGYRVFAIDGTAVNVATNPNTDSYMPNGEKNGYNQLHANILFDVCNKTYQQCFIQPQPRADEIGALYFMLAWHEFKEKTLIIADRGYEAYNVFAHFKEYTNVDFLIRIKQNRSAMREIRKLPMTELDVDISFTLTTTQTNADKENGYIYIQTARKSIETYSSKTRMRRWEFGSPYPMTLRIVRIQLCTGEYETLATSLPRSITAAEIKALYHARWKIETSFRDLKYGIGLEHLHGKSDDFARQEIFAALTMANFCGRVSQMAVIEKKTDKKLTYAVNRKMAIVLCRKYFADDNANDEELLEKIARYTEAVRPDRQNVRNLRIKSFSGFTYRIP